MTTILGHLTIGPSDRNRKRRKHLRAFLSYIMILRPPAAGVCRADFQAVTRVQAPILAPRARQSKFCHLVSYNSGTNIFRHRLSEKDTRALLHLLVRDSPEGRTRDGRARRRGGAAGSFSSVGYDAGPRAHLTLAAARAFATPSACARSLRRQAHPEDAPKDNVLPYEWNGYKRVPENPRFQEQRRLIYGD